MQVSGLEFKIYGLDLGLEFRVEGLFKHMGLLECLSLNWPGILPCRGLKTCSGVS